MDCLLFQSTWPSPDDVGLERAVALVPRRPRSKLTDGAGCCVLDWLLCTDEWTEVVFRDGRPGPGLGGFGNGSGSGGGSGRGTGGVDILIGVEVSTEFVKKNGSFA